MTTNGLIRDRITKTSYISYIFASGINSSVSKHLLQLFFRNLPWIIFYNCMADLKDTFLNLAEKIRRKGS